MFLTSTVNLLSEGKTLISCEEHGFNIQWCVFLSKFSQSLIHQNLTECLESFKGGIVTCLEAYLYRSSSKHCSSSN